MVKILSIGLVSLLLSIPVYFTYLDIKKAIVAFYDEYVK